MPEVASSVPSRSPLARAPASLGLKDALHLATPVDPVSVDERAQSFTKRSIKKESKLWGLKLAMSMIDLSCLEGADSPGRVVNRCRKAVRPDPMDPTVPSMAAICVYPDDVPIARKTLARSGVKTASVSTAFPAGLTTLEIKVLETRQAIDAGAEEIDMVMHRSAFLSGDYSRVFDEVAATKDVCGKNVCLKVILETGEIGSYDQIRRASMIAMCAGADFIKTSTGKITGRATLGNTQVMLECIRDFHELTGRFIGMKPAGNINTAKLTLAYMCQLSETLGASWMTPDLYRIGASALGNDILLQIRKEKFGTYQSPDYFTVD
jgi:deoxyribose-phosphate aldolase